MPFEGGSNSTWTRDYSTYGNNGTVMNATWNSTGGYDGHGAYMFNGYNSYIIPILGVPTLANAVTLSAWIYPTTTQIGTVISKNAPFYLAFGDEFNTLAQNIGAAIYNGSAWISLSGNTAIPIKTWSYIAMTYNGSALTVYLNGRQNGTIAASGPITYVGPNTWIGSGDPGINQFFNGSIDSVQIYNVALTPQEILNIYQNQSYIMDSSMLQPGQNWTACITPNDGTQDGSTACSNSLFVLNKINLTSFYPNATGGLQNITNQINVSINTNTSAATNLTFNITATESYPESLTFNWFINNILKFVQTLTSGFTSMFSQLFSTSGSYNVSVIVNGSNPANNKTFTFYLNLTSQPPFVNNVILNSTYGTNFTYENLTVSWNSTSYTSNLINITDWRLNGTSIAVLNMPFEGALLLLGQRTILHMAIMEL